jgi:hypothetical protein
MKKCRECKGLKPDDEFSYRNQAAGSRHGICIACFGVYRRRHYLDNKAQYFERNNRNIRLRAGASNRWLVDFLAEHPCIDCGETDPVVLEFDHIDRSTKRADVSILVQRGYSLAIIQAEIAKCVVRCANCHRRRTVTQLGWPRGRFKLESKSLQSAGPGMSAALEEPVDLPLLEICAEEFGPVSVC